jgi:SAM-dependent methyltransferase
MSLNIAQQNPNCQVVGSDLSLIQNEHAAPNCKFIQQDVENEEWDFDYKFDYIHFRYVLTCFDDMRSVVKKAFDNLKPGGWVEFYDPCPALIAVDDSVHGTAVERWNKLLVQGGLRANKDLLKAQKYAHWAKSVGFVDVTEERFPLPSNGKWPRDPKMKKIGMHSMVNQLSLVDSLTKLLELSDLSPEEISDLEHATKKDFQDARIHCCIDM